MLVFIGDQAPHGESLPVAKTWVHPDYDPRALHNDIALLRLTSPTAITPIPALPAALELTPEDADNGLMLDFVGFGYSDLQETQLGTKLHNIMPLGALGCPRSVYPSCPSGAPAETQFSYSQGIVEGPCNGDSGGPAFVERDGVIYVAGVTSYGDAACDDYGVSTTVSAFEAETTAFIAGAPPSSPDCSADGTCNGACAAGDDPDCGGDPPPPDSCGNGVCEDGESCDGRRGTQACTVDCDGVVKGKPAGRYCWVGDTCEGAGCS